MNVVYTVLESHDKEKDVDDDLLAKSDKNYTEWKWWNSLVKTWS